VLERVVARAREEEAGVLGVAAFGSYARGEAAPASDLDLEAVLREQPQVGYRTWFVDGLHVSIGFDSVERVRASLAEPARWSLKLAVEMPARWIEADAEARSALGDPPDFSRPPGEPELEDAVEWCAKALRASESLPLRVAARGLGEEAPALLRDLNGSPRVRSRVEAVRAASAFAVAPDGWADDLPVLLGLAPADDARVRDAVERVGRGVLRLLREHGAEVEQPELTRYLHDGTLERHLGFA